MPLLLLLLLLLPLEEETVADDDPAAVEFASAVLANDGVPVRKLAGNVAGSDETVTSSSGVGADQRSASSGSEQPSLPGVEPVRLRVSQQVHSAADGVKATVLEKSNLQCVEQLASRNCGSVQPAM